MNLPDAEWRDRARKLAATLDAEGVLHTPAWRAAVEETPRHVFVPRYYEQRSDGTWAEFTADSPGWVDTVYQNKPLITALANTPDGQRVTASSSTKPGLMVRMLEALDLADGHRVLEIGTGTGYNAALLAHALGPERVFSIDIAAKLVGDACDRLASVARTPTLAVRDGVAGLPDFAPYDRIVATCSVPAVPWAWAEQVVDGGLVLVDFKRNTYAGNLVLLVKHPDRLEGRFLPTWAGFMAMHHCDRTAEQVSHTDGLNPAIGRRSTTELDPHPWSALVPWLLAQADLPYGLSFGYQGLGAHGPNWVTFAAPDGSWAAVTVHTDDTATREVRQDGPTGLWDAFERAYWRWNELGQPGWDRLGLTVFPNGLHRLWLDEPQSRVRWDLPHK